MGPQTRIPYEIKLATWLLGFFLAICVMLTLTSPPLVWHLAYVGFMGMGAVHISGIVAHWLRVEKQPWIVWQGEFKYSYNMRQLIPTFVLFVLLLLVLATGLALLTPDIMDWSQQGGKK